MSSKIGVLIIGSKGAVSTTILAAKCAIEKGIDLNFRLPSEVEPVYERLGLRSIKDVVFGGWDIVAESYSQACDHHDIVPKHILSRIAEDLDKFDVYPAIMVEHDKTIEKLLKTANNDPRMQDVDYATTIFTKRPHMELLKSIEYDIAAFKKKYALKKVIMLNLASTEKMGPESATHKTIAAFKKGIEQNDLTASTGMLYAYAGIKNGCPLINFTPSVFFDIPALVEFAKQKKVPLAGKDGKTGQTLYKTTLAPMLKYRALKLLGWYSTNILGNRDGEVLNDPEHCATKITSKKAVLAKIMGYDDFDHQVHIHYYRPRGDAKEAWDNIDFMGWFNTPMQMKIDWLGDDSILAAPLVVDLIRWIDFLSDKKEYGVLDYLAVYFKMPIGTEECDFFKQIDMLKSHITRKYLKSRRKSGKVS